MQQNMLPSKLGSVERLIQRVVSAEKSNQREIRVSIQEARELITELALITGKLGQHISEIHQAINKKESNSNISISVDGGGL